MQATVGCLRTHLPFWKPLLSWVLMLRLSKLSRFYAFYLTLPQMQGNHKDFITYVHQHLCFDSERKNLSPFLNLKPAGREGGICIPSLFSDIFMTFMQWLFKVKCGKFSGNSCQSSRLKIAGGSVNSRL